MAANIATLEDLENIKAELIEEMRRLMGSAAQSAPTGQWLKSQQVRRLLSISSGTLQHLRLTGVLPFTKIGGVIYYDYEDLKAMIQSRKSNIPKLVRRQKNIKSPTTDFNYPGSGGQVNP